MAKIKKNQKISEVKLWLAKRNENKKKIWGKIMIGQNKNKNRKKSEVKFSFKKETKIEIGKWWCKIPR